MALQTSDPSAAVITSVGTVGNGGTISSTTPVITGTADVGDIVSIYDGVRLLGTALVGVNGTWSYTPTVALKLGAHSFAAIPQDSKGNFGASSATVGVQIASNVAPTPAITNVLDTIGTNATLVSIPSGGATSGNQPTVSGTGTAGATIYIYQNGAGCGTAVVDVTGHWSAKIPAAMTDGAHAMTAVQIGTGGQTSSASSASWTITINTTTPATPAAPTTTDDNGNPIPAGSTTADAHPHIHGKGTNGDTITVYDNGVVIGSTTVAGDGTWTFTPSPDLPNGNNSITVIETNPAGTSSATSPATAVVVDTTTPAAPVMTSATDAVGPIQGVIPANGFTDDSHPTIAGTGKAGDIITILNKGVAIGSTTADVNGKWSFKPTAALPEGATVLTATDTNKAGTTSAASAALSFTVDTLSGALPVITGATDNVGPVKGEVLSGGTTDDPRCVIHGTGHVGDIIKVYDGSTSYLWGSAVVGVNGTWSMTPTSSLDNNTHKLFAIATAGDGTGAVSAQTAFFLLTVDTTTPATPAAPTFTDDSGNAIAAGSTTADAHPHINGKGTAGDIITVSDNGAVIGSTTIGKDGTWSFTPTTDMANGNNSITVIETNPAGTPSAASTPVVITVNTTTPATPAAPTMTDDAGAAIPAGSATADAHPNFSGSGTSGDTIKLYDGTTLIGSAVIDSNGKWTIKPSVDLTGGAHDLYVTETTPAGTASAPSPHVALVVTVIPAAPTIDSLQAATTGDYLPVTSGSTVAMNASVKSSGHGEVGDTIKVYDNAVLIGSAVVGANGTWTFGWNAGTAPIGAHDLSVTQTNAAGTSPSSNHFKFTVEGQPATPAAPVMTDDAGAVIPAGSTTSDLHPHFSGTGTTGDIVTLYDGTTVVGSAVIDANGKWTFKPTTDLATGAHDLYVTETTPAGTTSDPSPHIALTTSNLPVETVTISSLIDDSSTVAVMVAAGGSTHDTSPIVNGLVSSALLTGESLVVYRDGVKLGNATVVGTAWSYNDTGVAVGAHTYTARVENSAGNGAYSGGYAFTETAAVADLTYTLTIDTLFGMDKQATVVPRDTSTGNYNLTLSGTMSIIFYAPGYNVVIYRDGVKLGDAAMSNNTFSFGDKAVPAGTHTYVARIESQTTGATSAFSPGYTYTETTTVPTETVNITSLIDGSSGADVNVGTGGSTHDTSLVVKGSLSSALLVGESLVVYRDGVKLGNATLNGTTWSYNDSSVAVGAHTYTARVEHSSGGTGGLSTGYSFTEVAPPIVVPTEAVVISSLIDDSTGTNVTVAPGGSIHDVSPIVQGTISSSLLTGDVVSVYRDGVKLGYATVSGTTWSFNDVGVAPGSHTYTARVENSAGQGPLSSGYTVIETATFVAPTATATVTQVVENTNDRTNVVPGGSTSSTTLMVSGTVSVLPLVGVGLQVAVYRDGIFIGDAGWSNNQWWLADKQVPAGTHVYTVRMEADAGGVGTFSAGFTIKELGVLTSSQLHATQDATDDTTHAASGVDSTQPDHHTVVGEHDAFIGTAANGNETVDLNADPASYFKETTAHIQGSGGTAIDTLHLTGDHQVLDLTSLTGQTAAAKISGIEVIDLGGHTNNLKLSLTDVLNLGEQDLFQKDGHQQLMVKGSDGDTVDLSNAHIAGVADGVWQAEGTAVVGGVTYNVYEHSGAHTELLVQQGVQIALHN